MLHAVYIFQQSRKRKQKLIIYLLKKIIITAFQSVSAIKQYPTNECTVELHDSALKLPHIEFVKITFLGGLQLHGIVKSRYLDVSNIEITKRIYIFRLLLLSFASFQSICLYYSLQATRYRRSKKIKMIEFYGVKEKGTIIRMNIVGDLNAWIGGISKKRVKRIAQSMYTVHKYLNSIFYL